MTGTGRSSHFSRDILDIRLFSKDSGFSRMVEWAGTRRTGIRWKPYKDVAKASTRRRFHLGNLREHSIVAVITRIRGNRQLYLRFFFLTSFKFREQPKRNRFGFQNLCDAEASIDTRTLFLYSIIFPLATIHSRNSRICIALANIESVADARLRSLNAVRNRFRERESRVMVEIAD